MGQPDIVSRGIIDMQETEDLLVGAKETVARVARTYADSSKDLTKPIEEALGRYLYAETGKRPFIKVIVK